MDVWFDSGSSWNGVLRERGTKFPSDLYLEGSDQYRGWFNSSLIVSLATTGFSPYKQVVSHGFVMDEKWEKMSKSKGNGLDPLKIINVYGADVLRLWAALTDYQQDVRISENIVKTISEQYRKIRNTFRFLLGNLSNGSLEDTFKAEDKQKELEEIDLFILARLEEVKNKVIDSMESYNFINAISEIMKFISDDLSSFYLDIAKDILYCEAKNSKRRLQVQTVLNELVSTLMRLLNPIIPFTMDEVNMNYPLREKDNVMYYDYPTKSSNYDSKLLDSYKLMKNLRDKVLLQLEKNRSEQIIGSAQEAKVELNVQDLKLKEELKKFDEAELARFFIVSEVELKDNGDEVKVSKHLGIKCERCWNYFDKYKIQEVEGTHLCARCLKALEK
ncbi:MAG: class I tRNA ligase family protein [Bacilli bacterium]|nr:class I tRNA ligase family protein [Bacilli bacterium]